MSCVFCKIAKKEIRAKVVYEDKQILGFDNIKPESPLHLLFIPKRHLEWEWEDKLGSDHLLLIAKIIAAAKKVAVEKRINRACKLIFNIGKTADISHVHLHLLGGWGKKVPRHNI